MRKLTLLAVAICVMLALPALAINEHSNRRAPGWSLPDTNFKFHDLMDFRGKVVLIEFMQTSCPHCQEATQNLKKIAGRYGPNVVLIHVVNPPSSMNDVQSYISKNQIASPVLFDSGQVAASYLRITPANPGFDVPHLFVVNKEGQIVNDFGYSPSTKDFFFGNALTPILDKLAK
ncbi:MAG: TlpA family protein disulfide reductase [Bryobacterales bacterium]|nr:TlpA family protein disulfide reductase [Bryobacterales bacterium]